MRFSNSEVELLSMPFFVSWCKLYVDMDWAHISGKSMQHQYFPGLSENAAPRCTNVC